MALQHDIQEQLSKLPKQQYEPLMTLLEAVTDQSTERLSDQEIKERVEATIHRVLRSKY
jgi:hypothetical protein